MRVGVKVAVAVRQPAIGRQRLQPGQSNHCLTVNEHDVLNGGPVRGKQKAFRTQACQNMRRPVSHEFILTLESKRQHRKERRRSQFVQ